MNARLLISCLVCGLGAMRLAAQQQPDATSTITVTTRIVAVDAIVRDAAGERLMNLDKDAFTLKVDGKPTPIRYFNRDNDLPLTIGILVDTSGSQRVYFDEEALNAENFLTATLTQPKDRAQIALFDTRVVLLQPLTSRLNELRNALRRLDYVDTSTQGRTLLYDAIAAFSKSFASTEPGRHALVILTDGEDNGSRASRDDAVHQAQLADVAVYSVLYTGEMIGTTLYPATPGHLSGVTIMQEISKATGGRAFVVGAGTPIATIFAEIEQDLRSQYRFGFTPPPTSKPGKVHSIDLRTADKHQIIQARRGFYTPQ